MLGQTLTSERGSSLLETLIALGIVSIAASALATVLANQIRSAKSADHRMTEAEIVNSMLVNVDCPETIYQACRHGNRRLYSTQGPLQFALPYQVDRAMGLTLDVRCESGLVNIHYALDGRRGEPVIPGGLCKHRFSGPKECPSGKVLIEFDEEKGTIKCRDGKGTGR